MLDTSKWHASSHPSKCLLEYISCYGSHLKPLFLRKADSWLTSDLLRSRWYEAAWAPCASTGSGSMDVAAAGRNAAALHDALRRLEGAPYKAYHDIEGAWACSGFIFILDRAQSDPYAQPSRCRVKARPSGNSQPLDHTSCSPPSCRACQERMHMSGIICSHYAGTPYILGHS